MVPNALTIWSEDWSKDWSEGLIFGRNTHILKLEQLVI